MRRVQVVVATVVGLLATSAMADVTIRGRVTGADGRPVADALVFCLRPQLDSSLVESVDGKTNGDGFFELNIVGADPVGLKNASVLVYAAGHGLGVTTAGSLLERPANEPPMTVALPAEQEKRLRIVDPGGRPVTGALVEPVNYLYGSPQTSQNYGPGCQLPETLKQTVGRITDELGVMSFTALQADKLRTVQVVSEQYGHQEVGYPARIESIRLRDTARVEVTFDRTQGSIGKCRVVAYTSPPSGSAPFGPNDVPREKPTTGVHYSTLADDPKGFEIPKIATGGLMFRLSRCSTEESVLPVWPGPIQLEAGATRKIVVPLEKTGSMRGRVLDHETRKPCANVAVMVSTGSGRNVMTTRTDGEGWYRCNVLRGRVQVGATYDHTNEVYGVNGSLEADVRQDGFEFPEFLLKPQAVAGR